MNRFVEIWLLYAATCSAGGWMLSWLHALNPLGYLLVHGGFLVFILCWYRGEIAPLGRLFRKLRKRFFPQRLACESWFSLRRFLPFGFLTLASLSLVAGLLYAPNNYDALTYRIPRVMHWLQNEGWHWIHTDNARMNTRATGFEWLMAPQLSILKSDRLVFSANFISYLLLPGLLFSFLVSLGAASRAAWVWMWIFPWGLGYVLQSSGITNDAFATLYSLSALIAGLKFFRLGRTRDLVFSILGAALLSGTKASNLPLLLPIAAIVVGGFVRLGARTAACFFVAAPLLIFSGLVSFFPNAWTNYRHCGDWTGTSLEEARFVKSPWVGLVGNGLQILAQNFSPPVLPEAKQLDDFLVERIPQKLLIPLKVNFESSFRLGLGEIPTEGSGLGLGLSLCLLYASLRRNTHRIPPTPSRSNYQKVVLWLGPLALLWFLSKSALAGISRVILPYFPLALAPIMTLRGGSFLHQSKIFKGLILFTFLSALGAAIFDPSKPLWPAQKVLSSPFSTPWLEKARSRALQVYSNYGQRAEVYQAVRPLLPAGVHRLGFFNGTDDPVASLWKPYGTLEIEEILADESLIQVQKRGLTILLAGERGLRERCNLSLEQWINLMQGTPVGKVTLRPSVQRGDEVWVLLAIPPGPTDLEAR